MKWGQSLLICLCIVFIVVSVICHLIALITNFWLKSDTQEQFDFLNLGLWVGCFDRYTHPHEKPQRLYDGCHYLQSDYYATIQDWLVPSWLIVCRILAIIALILQIVGIIFFILLVLIILCKWFCYDRKRGCCGRCLMYATPILWIVAGMFLMMTIMIFADQAFRLQCKDFWVNGNDPNDNHLSWSWGFEIVACIFSFISGGFLVWLVVLKARDEY